MGSVSVRAPSHGKTPWILQTLRGIPRQVTQVPPFHEGRFSNGPTWIDVLADALALPRPTPSEAGGKNYAVGGAETVPGFAALVPFAPNLGEQVNSFLLDGHELMGRELIIIRGGANNMIAQAFLEPPDETFRTPERAVANIVDHVTTLAGAGGTRFLVANLGGFADIPLMRPSGLTADATVWQEEFDDLLEEAMAGLQAELRISIYFLDGAALARMILGDPAEFRLTNLSDPAWPGCGRPRRGRQAFTGLSRRAICRYYHENRSYETHDWLDMFEVDRRPPRPRGVRRSVR